MFKNRFCFYFRQFCDSIVTENCGPHYTRTYLCKNQIHENENQHNILQMSAPRVRTESGAETGVVTVRTALRLIVFALRTETLKTLSWLSCVFLVTVFGAALFVQSGS